MVGGGAVGVEVAGELAANHTVTLTAREDELVRNLPEAARRYALEALRSKNVRVELNTRRSAAPSTRASRATAPGRGRAGSRPLLTETRAASSASTITSGHPWKTSGPPATASPRTPISTSRPTRTSRASTWRMVASEITGRAPPDPYVAPARIVALALGPDDGVLCYGRVVVLRGRAVPWVKALVERWVVRLWPLPYELFRRLPALARGRCCVCTAYYRFCPPVG